jgi:small subunit ribosomal protein S6
VEQKLNKYEAMFLLNHAKVPPEGAESVQVVSDVLTKHGARIERCEIWGERKLAYPIQHQRRGTYVLAHIEAAPGAIANIQHEINISESILRWLPERQGSEFPPFRTAADWAEASGRRPRRDRPEGGRDDREGGRDDREGGRGPRGPAPQRSEAPTAVATPPAAAPEAAAPTPPEAPAAEPPASAPAPEAEPRPDAGPAADAGPESDKPETSA